MPKYDGSSAGRPAPQQPRPEYTQAAPGMLVDETPVEGGGLYMSVAFDEDGRPAGMLVRGTTVAAMRSAIAELAAENEALERERREFFAALGL